MSKLLTLLAFGLVVLTTSAARAEDVLNEHKKALGKPETLEKVKSIRRTGEIEMTGPFSDKGTIEESAILGKKSSQKIEMANFQSTQVWDGEKGWVSNTFAATQELGENQVGQMKGIASINPFVGLLAEMPQDKIVAGADADFEGVACKTYKLNDEMTAYMGKEDHLFHGMVVKVSDPASGGEANIKVVYSDFKEHDGIKFADKVVTNLESANMVITMKFTKTEINPSLDDKLFAKP